ncbi:uncharacterized protein A4U43_C07F39040 [Asparagus officinalis]|uniref:Uncharacterized protein n=1 Tax=Asparagus officinalis TaxID=4686 RepID=A0A5P1ELG5_ASPOF|nr:uncharacterized protein A4U43_C07F39040 [Asparagus officinalis]
MQKPQKPLQSLIQLDLTTPTPHPSAAAGDEEGAMSLGLERCTNKIARKVDADSIPAQVMESVKKMLPNRQQDRHESGQRGLFAGRHIQFGNKTPSKDSTSIPPSTLKF